MERIQINEVSLELLTAGDGPPLLFLHGGDYFAQHREFFDRLARHWRVVVPRHPGFGNSERPDGFRTVHDLAYLYLDLLQRQDIAQDDPGGLFLRRLDRAGNVRPLPRADRSSRADRLGRRQVRRARRARHRRYLRASERGAAAAQLLRPGTHGAGLRPAQR